MSTTATITTSVVSVQGRYFYNEDGSRFFIKGIAFPAPTKSHSYNETAWIDVLRQIKVTLEADINTIRLYRMDPRIDYSGFFDYAASLGVYVLVPLTSVSGDGILDRTLAAPKCYSHKLLEYGVACLENYMQYPNTLAGVVGNEVMDSLEAWMAAPCIKAYVRDLKRHMTAHMNRKLPLVYTAQDNGIGAAVTAPDAMRLTASYLSCHSSRRGNVDASIDVFGINVESWCSSTGSYRFNDDGTVGTYYELHEALSNTSVALVFAEMGCAHSLFNRDNHDIIDKTRDWKQVPVVLKEMADTWSGFCAYTYDGNPDFNMFRGGPWNDERDVLEPTQDFYNFRDQLNLATVDNSTTLMRELQPPLCETVLEEMQSCCDKVFVDHHIDLYDVDKIPSYRHRSKLFGAEKQSFDDDNGFVISHDPSSSSGVEGIILVVLVVALSVAALLISRSRRRMREQWASNQDDSLSLNVQYQSIN